MLRCLLRWLARDDPLREVKELTKQVAARQATADDVARALCPKCGSPLKLFIDPSGDYFVIDCAKTPTHVAPHGEYCIQFERFQDADTAKDPSRDLAQLCKRIRSGKATREEVDGYRCPLCRSPLTVGFAPDGHLFGVFCGTNPLHVYRIEAAEVLPDWWRSVPPTLAVLDG